MSFEFQRRVLDLPLVRLGRYSVAILLLGVTSAIAQVEPDGPVPEGATLDDQDSVELSELNRHLMFNAQSRQLQEAWNANDVSQTRHWLDQQIPSDGEIDLRGFAWQYYHRLSQRGRRLDHGEACSGVAFSPDGSTFASVGRNGVKLWNVANSQPSGTLEHDSATHVIFSPDGSQLLTWLAWGRDVSIKLWSVDSLELVYQVEGGAFAKFSLDGRRLAIAVGQEVRIVDAQDQTPIVTLTGHTGKIHDVAFSPDGSRIATGGHDRAARVWDAREGTLIAEFLNSRGRVEAVAFAGNDQHLLINEFLYGVRLFDVETREEIDRFRNRVRFNDFHTGFAFSQDGKIMALASNYVTDSRVDLWDLAKGTRIKQFLARRGEDVDVAMAADADWVAVSRQADRSISVWNFRTWERVHSFCINNEQRGYYGQRLALSPDGSHLAFANGNTVVLFDLRTKDVVAGKGGVAFSPDGEELFAAEGSAINVYDVGSGAPKREIQTVHDLAVGRVAIAQGNGRILASRPSSPELYLWDDATSEPRSVPLVTQEPVDARPMINVTALALSPSGRLFAAAGRQIPLQVHDLQGQKPVVELNEAGTPYVAALSDAGTLATSGTDTTIHLWDVNSGQSLGELAGHRQRVSSLAFTEDGKYLASHDVLTARIWNVEEQSLLHEVTVRTGRSNRPSYGRTLAFLPDATHLIVGGYGRLLQVDVATGETVATYSTAYWLDDVWNLQRRSSSDNQWSSGDQQVTLVAVSRDGERVAAQFSDGQFCVWNRADQKGVAMSRLGSQALAMRLNENGSRLVACGLRLHRLDLASGEWEPARSPSSAANIFALDYSPSRQQIVTTVASMRRVGHAMHPFCDIRLWDATSGRQVGQLTPSIPVAAIGFVPDSEWLVGIGSLSTSRGQINQMLVWDGATGELFNKIDGVTKPYVFSPDGKRIAFGSRTVRIKSMPELEDVYEFESDAKNNAFAFAPATSDKAWLAAAGDDHVIRIMDYETGEVVARMVGHARAVTALAFAPDGETFASGSTDETVRVWDLTTLSLRVSLKLDYGVTHLAFTPDGRTIAAGLTNGKIRILRGSDD